MGQQYLIDSNTVIDFLSGKLPQQSLGFINQIVNDTPNLSVITKIEVLGFNAPTDAAQLLNDFINDSIILGLENDIIDTTIKIRKKHKIKTPDAIIAATALVFGFVLITRNEKDFNAIQNLAIINPYGIIA